MTVTKTPLTPAQLATLESARKVHVASLALPEDQRKTAAKEYMDLVRGVIGADVIGPCVNGARAVNRVSTDFVSIIHTEGTEPCKTPPAKK